MRLNLRELVLKYKGRPIEWGLGAWAEVERTVWMPLIQRPICNKIQKKKRNITKRWSPWFSFEPFWIWGRWKVTVCWDGGDSLTLRLIISLYTNKIPFLISINENAPFSGKICFKIDQKSFFLYSRYKNHNFIPNRISYPDIHL